MLASGQILRNVPNWWNHYAPNLRQKDPKRKLQILVNIKIFFMVITMLGGAILALLINVIGNTGKHGYVILTCRNMKKQPGQIPTHKADITENKTSPQKPSLPSQSIPEQKSTSGAALNESLAKTTSIRRKRNFRIPYKNQLNSMNDTGHLKYGDYILKLAHHFKSEGSSNNTTRVLPNYFVPNVSVSGQPSNNFSNLVN